MFVRLDDGKFIYDILSSPNFMNKGLLCSLLFLVDVPLYPNRSYAKLLLRLRLSDKFLFEVVSDEVELFDVVSTDAELV